MTGNVFNNIFYSTIHYAAQIVQGGCGDSLVVAQFVDCGTGDMVVFDKGIGGFG